MKTKTFLAVLVLFIYSVSLELKTDSIEFNRWNPSTGIWTEILYNCSFEAQGLNELKVIAIAPERMVWDPETLLDTSGSLTNFDLATFESESIKVALPWYLSNTHNYTGGKISIRLIAKNKYYNPYPVLYSSVIDTTIEYQIAAPVSISRAVTKEFRSATSNTTIKYYDISGKRYHSLKGLTRGVYIQRGIKSKKIIIR